MNKMAERFKGPTNEIKFSRVIRARATKGIPADDICMHDKGMHVHEERTLLAIFYGGGVALRIINRLTNSHDRWYISTRCCPCPCPPVLSIEYISCLLFLHLSMASAAARRNLEGALRVAIWPRICISFMIYGGKRGNWALDTVTVRARSTDP